MDFPEIVTVDGSGNEFGNTALAELPVGECGQGIETDNASDDNDYPGCYRRKPHL